MTSSEELCRNMAFSLALRCIQNNPWWVYSTPGQTNSRKHAGTERKCVEINKEEKPVVKKDNSVVIPICLSICEHTFMLPFTFRYVMVYVFYAAAWQQTSCQLSCTVWAVVTSTWCRLLSGIFQNMCFSVKVRGYSLITFLLTVIW